MDRNGVLWSRTKRSKTQYNKGAGKEIILLIYEYNVSHSSWSFSYKFALRVGMSNGVLSYAKGALCFFRPQLGVGQ